VKIFYNEIPHTFTSTYRNLWSGAGSANLTLNTLTPGGTSLVTAPVYPNNPTAAQITAADTAARNKTNADSAQATHNNTVNAIDALDDSELSLIRRTGGMSFDKYITNAWRFYGSYSRENRTGARPFGMVFSGVNAEIPESIDYDTHDILGALRFDDGVNNLNLQVNMSLFRNNIDTMTVQNPGYILATATAPVLPATVGNLSSNFPAATFDLYPDNDYYNLRAEYARSMPQWYRSRLTATVSLSKFKQDDNLVPSTQYSLQGMAFNGVSAFNNWNTPASNSKQSAGAEIDTQLFDLGWVMRPTEKLDLNAKFRYYNNDNKTDYLACNPLTGQWGRVLQDGVSAGEILTPNLTAG
jgi:hypothetical protein